MRTVWLLSLAVLSCGQPAPIWTNDEPSIGGDGKKTVDAIPPAATDEAPPDPAHDDDTEDTVASPEDEP